MGWVAPLMMGISGLGGLFGNRQQQQNQNINTSGSQTGGYTGSTTPNLNPQAQGLLDPMISKYMSMLGGTDLSGYQAGGVSDINKMANICNQNIQENLASRGVFGPAASTAYAGSEGQRTGDISKFNQSIPLLQQQLTQQALQTGQGLFNMIPYGQSQQGTTEQQNQQQQRAVGTSPGNMLGGLFNTLGGILPQLYGMGLFSGGGQNPAPFNPNPGSQYLGT